MTGPKISRPAWRERRARRDDVGDRVGDTESNRRLDRAVELDELAGGDAVTGEEPVHEARIARRDANAVEIGEFGEGARRPGEAEGRVTEAERRDLSGIRPGIEQQVATRDADVERTRADVGGDVARTEVEELDPVARVCDVQVARVATTGVARLPEHLGGGLSE